MAAKDPSGAAVIWIFVAILALCGILFWPLWLVALALVIAMWRQGEKK